MRETGAARVPGDGIPLLRYLHLVRMDEPDGRTLILLFCSAF